jgi:hypothetical protein
VRILAKRIDRLEGLAGVVNPIFHSLSIALLCPINTDPSNLTISRMRTIIHSWFAFTNIPFLFFEYIDLLAPIGGMPVPG